MCMMLGFLCALSLFLSSHSTMPVTTRSQSRALAAATTTLAVTPEEETTTQDAIESSPAAIEPAATEPVAIEPAAAPTIPIVPRPRKPKRPRSTTDPGIKGPANAPKRTKTMPTYNEQAVSLICLTY